MRLIHFADTNDADGIRDFMNGKETRETKIENILEADSRGWSALHQAAYHGHIHLMKLMLSIMTVDEKRDAVTRLTWMRENCLAVACTSRRLNMPMLRLLLRLRSDPNNRDRKLQTPLIVACQRKNKLRVVELLVKYGADVLVATAQSFCPLDFAISLKDMDVINFILKCYAEKRQSNVSYYTFSFAHLNVPEIVPDVLRLLGSDGIRLFLNSLNGTRMCRFFNRMVERAKSTFKNYERSLISLEIDKFVSHHFGLGFCGFEGTHPDQIIMLYADLYAHTPDRLRVPPELCYEPVDDFGKTFCKAVGESGVRLDVAPRPDETLCEEGLLKYFPELDIRPKFTLRAHARHSFRCGLNRKMGCWNGYNWLLQECNIPGLNSYLMYEDHRDLHDESAII